MEETKNYELCIACGCTSNRQGQEFCGDCGFQIEEDYILIKKIMLEEFYNKVTIGDIVKMKVLINQHVFGNYIYGVVEESDEVLSGTIIDKKLSYIDIDDLTDEEPEIIGNIKDYPNFKENGYILNNV